MPLIRRFALAAALLLCGQAMAATISIQYTVTPLGGNLYRYVYTISNNGSLGSGVNVQFFDIYFDASLYQSGSLHIVSPPSIQAQWSELVFSPISGVPAAYDVLSLSGGIPTGSSVSGFAVEFRWLGAGVPGAQPFEVFDPVTFLSLQKGTTTPPASVPAASPESLSVLALALGIAGAIQAKRRTILPGPAR
jgi:hypothetical protein